MIHDPRLASAIDAETLRDIEELCTTFEADWRSGRRPIIEELLGQASGLKRSAMLRELLALELEYRHRGGERPAPAEYISRFPDDRDILDLAFQEAESFASRDLETLGVAHVESQEAAAPLPRTFGDYELLDEIARGGMGVVYRARQISLDRTVAVKMILSGQLASTAEVERFFGEAKSAAALHHPNIVPIIEVGQRHGQSFFSMGFVEGRSLAHRLAEGPLPPREAAQLLLSVAGAVEYAHGREIIHRDLKPANILLDLNGTPHVTDFGLAKRAGGDSSLTATGQIIGTPSFMPPEQAAGNLAAIGRASDVYSLGAVLYAALTGRPPFQAASTMDTLKQVLEQEPISPRRLDPTVPRDLETITLKCLQKQPARRYESAQSLADELRRYLSGQPIAARPVSRIERGWRWCRRNPAVTALAAAAVIALVSGTAVSSYFAIEASARATEAVAERKRAESGFRGARAAVDKYYTTVSKTKLLNEPSLQPLHKELLESALAYYQEFIVQYGDDANFQPEMAATYENVAQIMGKIGSKEQCIEMFKKAVAIRDKMSRDDPDDDFKQHALIGCRHDLAMAQNATGRKADAEASYKEAIAGSEKLVRKNPNEEDFRSYLANHYVGLGILQHETGRNAEAEATYEKALEIREELVRKRPLLADYQMRLAAIYKSLGVVQRDTGRGTAAEASYKKAMEISEKVADANPAVIGYQFSLSSYYADLGNVQHVTGRRAEAEKSYKKALEINEKLVRENPTITEYQSGLGLVCLNLAASQRATGRLAEAEATNKRALDIFGKLARENPSVTAYQHRLGAGFSRLAAMQLTTARHAEGEGSYTRALEIFDKLVRENPAVIDYQSGLGDAYLNLGTVQNDTGRSAEAGASYTRALEILDKLARENPAVTDYQYRLGATYARLASMQLSAARYAEAEGSCKRVIEIHEKLVREYPAVSDYRQTLAKGHSDLGTAQRNMGRLAEAEKSHEMAIDILEKLVRENPTVVDYQGAYANAYNLLAVVQLDAGRTADGEVSFKKAIALRESLARDNPAVADYQSQVAQGYDALGAKQRGEGRNAEAEASYNKSIEMYEKLVRENPTVSDYKQRLASSYGRLGDALAMLGKWKEAAGTFGKAVESGNHEWYAVYRLALAQLAAGDEAAYRAACADLLARHGADAKGETAYCIAMACVAGERAVEDTDSVVALAKRAAASTTFNPVFQTALGVAQFRAGRTEEAIATLKAASPQHGIALLAAPAMADAIRLSQLHAELYLAMCYRDLKDDQALQTQTKKARALFEKLQASPRQEYTALLPWIVPWGIEIAKRELAKLSAEAPAGQ